MPNYTPNYNLKKPLSNENYNVEDQNNNMDIIDEKLKEIEDGIENIEVPVTSVNEKTGDVVLTAEDVGAETPTGAQAKADAAEAAAKAYADQEVADLAGEGRTTETVKGNADALDAHLAESAIHKTSDVIRTETETKLKVELVSSSVSETPDAGRIIFVTSQGKFFGGNGTEWV